MIILGIDPGLEITGYGVVQTGNTGKRANIVLDYGVIRTKKIYDLSHRLQEIYNGVKQLLDLYKPDGVAVESLFFCSNQKTVMAVGQARGVVLLAIRQAGAELKEYTPKQVKQNVVGYGVAEKSQMQYMIKSIFSLESIPKPDDAADGLGLCWCYLCELNNRAKA